MQIVDILCHDQQLARPCPVERRQRFMRGIGLDLRKFRPALIIEMMHQHRIARQRFGRADILDPMPLPQAVRATKSRKAAFGGNTCAGEDDNVPNVWHPRTQA